MNTQIATSIYNSQMKRSATWAWFFAANLIIFTLLSHSLIIVDYDNVATLSMHNKYQILGENPSRYLYPSLTIILDRVSVSLGSSKLSLYTSFLIFCQSLTALCCLIVGEHIIKSREGGIFFSVSIVLSSSYLYLFRTAEDNIPANACIAASYAIFSIASEEKRRQLPICLGVTSALAVGFATWAALFALIASIISYTKRRASADVAYYILSLLISTATLYFFHLAISNKAPTAALSELYSNFAAMQGALVKAAGTEYSILERLSYIGHGAYHSLFHFPLPGHRQNAYSLDTPFRQLLEFDSTAVLGIVIILATCFIAIILYNKDTILVGISLLLIGATIVQGWKFLDGSISERFDLIVIPTAMIWANAYKGARFAWHKHLRVLVLLPISSAILYLLLLSYAAISGQPIHHSSFELAASASNNRLTDEKILIVARSGATPDMEPINQSISVMIKPKQVALVTYPNIPRDKPHYVVNPESIGEDIESRRAWFLSFLGDAPSMLTNEDGKQFLSPLVGSAGWSPVSFDPPLWRLKSQNFNATAIGSEHSDQDILGKDIRSFRSQIPDPAICILACREEEGCDGATFVRPPYPTADAVCVLKGSVLGVKQNVCCTSWLKYNFTPPSK
jgi:hypothetical protein